MNLCETDHDSDSLSPLHTRTYIHIRSGQMGRLLAVFTISQLQDLQPTPAAMMKWTSPSVLKIQSFSMAFAHPSGCFLDSPSFVAMASGSHLDHCISLSWYEMSDSMSG